MAIPSCVKSDGWHQMTNTVRHSRMFSYGRGETVARCLCPLVFRGRPERLLETLLRELVDNMYGGLRDDLRRICFLSIPDAGLIPRHIWNETFLRPAGKWMEIQWL